jgi:GMP synthase (glutamine-hydrolysing)
MRHNESAAVATALHGLGVRLRVVDASAAFHTATTSVAGRTTERLCETISPEIKRKIIGDTFMRVSGIRWWSVLGWGVVT